MTAPGNGFGTHDCNPFRRRELHQIVQVFSELPRLHIVGKATKARVIPAGVDGIPGRMPEATQTWHVPVVKAGGMLVGDEVKITIELEAMRQA